jgi:hypothetical protein
VKAAIRDAENANLPFVKTLMKEALAPFTEAILWLTPTEFLMRTYSGRAGVNSYVRKNLTTKYTERNAE